jgi:hypothetical protein
MLIIYLSTLCSAKFNLLLQNSDSYKIIRIYPPIHNLKQTVTCSSVSGQMKRNNEKKGEGRIQNYQN